MLGTIVPMFVMTATIIVGLGLGAMWAEFKSAGKRNEYDRYTYARS
jgi:hypothetical protein